MNKIVGRNEETKFSAATLISGVQINGNFINASQFLPALPSVVTGPDRNQRVGYKISPTRHTLEFFMGIPERVTVNANVIVKIFVLTSKKYKAMGDLIVPLGPGSIIANTLLDAGNNTLTNPFGTMDSAALPFWKGEWTVLKTKTIRLAKPPGVQNLAPTQVTPPTADGSASANLNAFHHFTMVLPKPPVLKYDNDTQLFPSNYAPVIGFMWYYDDFQAVPPTEPLTVAATVRSNLYYKDD